MRRFFASNWLGVVVLLWGYSVLLGDQESLRPLVYRGDVLESLTHGSMIVYLLCIALFAAQSLFVREDRWPSILRKALWGCAYVLFTIGSLTVPD